MLAHAEGVMNKMLMYVNCNSITLVDKSTSKRTRIKTKRYCDINYNSPQKKTKLGKKIVPIIECLSDDSPVTSESEVVEDTIIIKEPVTTLDISLLRAFHIYVGDFKLNHENQRIINTVLFSAMLLNNIPVSFDSNSDHSYTIDIRQYLKFVKKQKENLENHSSIKGTNLYKEVMLRKYFDIFQTVIYQYNKNAMQAFKRKI